jgi:hypothetical protein
MPREAASSCEEGPVGRESAPAGAVLDRATGIKSACVGASSSAGRPTAYMLAAERLQMQRIRRLLVAPVMMFWLVSQRYNNQSVPRPTDAPHGHAPGSDSHRILIFGSGPAVGWGMLSHEIALPGSLARALAARTGRGADVDVVADMKINVGNALGILRRVAVDQHDSIVVVLGPNDALPLTPLARWSTRLARVLAHLDHAASPDTRIFVTGVPPIPSLPGFKTRLGAIAQNHASQMNEATAELCRSAPRTTFVPLSAARELPLHVSADGRTYRYWANEIADSMAPQLIEDRWLMADG